MKGQSVPMRTCIGCRKVREKASMLRMVRTPEGRIQADPGGKTAGRGAYVCEDPSCLEKALRQRTLNRAFSCEISREDYERLRQALTKDGIPDPAGAGRPGIREADR